MVQRNFTPGGDKNGADITMALDALEMAFTHDHINGFVIVGGDSDFISLVEKLKQYGRRVIVVGGRQFTSLTMQRNCHEFIAYENLVGVQTSHRRQSERGGRQPQAAATGGSPIANALPLVLRALKVLSEREVTPQLGLLKSTLLQLDSTFSEREYGGSSFRDFMEKVAQTGAVELKHSGRSMLVEAIATEGSLPAVPVSDAPASEPVAAAAAVVNGARPDADGDADAEEDEESIPPSPMSMQDGIKAVQHAFAAAGNSIRWPMYVRQARQFLRGAIQGFDERKYGFASVVDLLRAAGKEGVFRIERDRQGAVRIFPGANLTPKVAPMEGLPVDIDEEIDVEVPTELVADAADAADDTPVVEGTVDPLALPDEPMTARADIQNDRSDDDAIEDDGPQPGNSIHEPVSRGRKTKAASPRSRAPRAPRGAAKTARPRAPRKGTKA
jgi:hypothetical protein